MRMILTAIIQELDELAGFPCSEHRSPTIRESPRGSAAPRPWGKQAKLLPAVLSTQVTTTWTDMPKSKLKGSCVSFAGPDTPQLILVNVTGSLSGCTPHTTRNIE